MNIEAYNLDSLRKLVRSLQDENRRLKAQLEKANIAYASQNIFEEKTTTIEEYDPDQGERILYQYITEDMVNKYFAMFWGRMDVYAKRGAKGRYFPQCNNSWNNRICPKQCGEKINCEVCEHTEWTKLETIVNDITNFSFRFLPKPYAQAFAGAKRKFLMSFTIRKLWSIFLDTGKMVQMY